MRDRKEESKSKPNMGLTSWRKSPIGKIRSQCAKSFLFDRWILKIDHWILDISLAIIR